MPPWLRAPTVLYNVNLLFVAALTTVFDQFQAEDLEKLRKRAERFGENVSSAVTKANAQELLEKRKAKFQATSAVAKTKVCTWFSLTQTEVRRLEMRYRLN